MGLVLDSGVLIAGERDAKPVRKLLVELEHGYGETVIELKHGLHRAKTAEWARKRREYLDAVFAAVPVEPFIRTMAQTAAKIDAEARQFGRTIPFADLLIGATALHFGYAVGTRNLRHFRMISDLPIVQV